MAHNSGFDQETLSIGDSLRSFISKRILDFRKHKPQQTFCLSETRPVLIIKIIPLFLGKNSGEA